MSKASAPSQRMLRAGELIRHALAFFLSVYLILCPAFAESHYFSVDVQSIEVNLIDRASGKLSGDILGASENFFISVGGMWDTKSKPADDVLLRVTFKSKGDGNIQPQLSLVAVAHSNSPEAIKDRFARSYVLYWESFNEPTFNFDSNGLATVSTILKSVTCSHIDIIVHVGDGDPLSGNTTVDLPFVCKAK
jgi:hypothetical protein